MIPSGIVDPTKVTRTALENAASIASCVLTTESLVADKPDPKADAAMAAAAARAVWAAACIDPQLKKLQSGGPHRSPAFYVSKNRIDRSGTGNKES